MKSSRRSPRGPIITIDGPSGTGKSTIARRLAGRLGFLYLDTGAMYRAVALKALRERVPLTADRLLTRLATRSRVTFRKDSGGRARVLLDGADVTRAIRRPEVSEAASQVATIPGVRRALVRHQRLIGAGGRVVMEGRDTGTVVFPKADLKVFLTADLTERARRRWRDLRRLGLPTTFAQVLRDVRGRDARDRGRRASPLRQARGAVKIDNTKLQSSQVLDTLLDYVRNVRKRSKRGDGLERRAG